MTTTNSAEQESVAEELREPAKRLQLLTLAESTPTCYVCERHITEGQGIILYLKKSVDGRKYNIGQLRCEEHWSGVEELFEIGTRELIVTGRVGQCRDQATRTSWPVLIAPVIRQLSKEHINLGEGVYLNKQPTDPEDKFAGFKPTVPGMTEPSRPPTGGKE
jgi:hypothetical protein